MLGELPKLLRVAPKSSLIIETIAAPRAMFRALFFLTSQQGAYGIVSLLANACRITGDSRCERATV